MPLPKSPLTKISVNCISGCKFSFRTVKYILGWIFLEIPQILDSCNRKSVQIRMVVFSSFEFHFLKSSPFGLIVYFFLIRIRKPKIRNFDNSASKNTQLSNRLSERIWFHNPCWRRHLVTSSEVWKNMISHTWCTHHNIWYYN